MRPSNSMPTLGITALTILVLLSAAVCASAQTNIEYDWETRTRTACPSEINRSQSGEVVIRNINDILFEYRLSIIETPRAIDDWQQISGLITRPSRAIASSEESGLSLCEKTLQEAKEQLGRIKDIADTDPALPLGYKQAGQNASVRLSKSRAAWDRIEELREQLRPLVAQLEGCRSTTGISDFLKLYREIDARLEKLETKVRGPHELRHRLTIRPNTDYNIKVVELFEGAATDSGDVSFDCKPASGQLTLTAGVLFSTIADRAYESRKVPGAAGNVLAVEGNSNYRPEGVLLLNYLLPRLDNETSGLALSAGPVIRFGSKSDLSTLGFFTGLSAHLYRRLYITPGFHFGEFADFPVGFGEGQAVPSDFGTITPVKRWTTRFALAISFRTATFSGLGGSGDGDDTETVHMREGDGGINSGHPRDMTASTRSLVSDSAHRFRPASYISAESVEYNSFMRTAALRSLETLSGSQVIIAVDSTLQNYTTFTINNVLYIQLPQTKGVLSRGELNGRAFKAAKLEQKGDNLTISFIIPSGVTASVTQKFNRLEVSFNAPAAELATASR